MAKWTWTGKEEIMERTIEQLETENAALKEEVARLTNANLRMTGCFESCMREAHDALGKAHAAIKPEMKRSEAKEPRDEVKLVMDRVAHLKAMGLEQISDGRAVRPEPGENLSAAGARTGEVTGADVSVTGGKVTATPPAPAVPPSS